MGDNAQGVPSSSDEAPALVRCIGKTTYYVRIHFSQTSHETMQDKIKRMLRDEAQQM
ncbi:MAG: transposon-encoded TnpW family protein [Eubacteriales bacterium]|nr:transposon-encoded TnpW family protein [Eubacteriales bacterium]